MISATTLRATAATRRRVGHAVACSSSARSSPKTRRLDVAVVGAPNAGKSQLLNRLCRDGTVAAVSRKRHTTHRGVVGVRTIDDCQLVFVDTPGFSTRRRRSRERPVSRDLTRAARDDARGSDHTLLVVDAARRLDRDARETIAHLVLRAVDERDDDDDAAPRRRRTFDVVLNKVDLVTPKRRLLDVAEEIGGLAAACLEAVDRDPVLIARNATSVAERLFRENDNDDHDDDDERWRRRTEDLYPEFFYTDALRDEGVDDVVRGLVRLAPEREWIFEAHETTDSSPLERVEEILREKIYRTVHREVPHAVTQVNRVFSTSSDGGVLRIEQDLVVRTESHRRILSGRNGATLRRVQEQAERDVAATLGRRVALRLRVKKRTGHDHRHHAD